MQATVYILRCADGSYYTGLTREDVDSLRVWEHNNDPIDGYTARRAPGHAGLLRDLRPADRRECARAPGQGLVAREGGADPRRL